MKLFSSDARAFLTKQLSEFLTEIQFPISIQSSHLAYAVKKGWISRESRTSQKHYEYFMYEENDLIALAKLEAFRALMRQLRDESRQYSALIEKGVPRTEAGKLAFQSEFHRR